MVVSNLLKVLSGNAEISGTFTCDQLIARQIINTNSDTAFFMLKYSDGSYVILRNTGGGAFSVKVNNDNTDALSIANTGVTTFHNDINIGLNKIVTYSGILKNADTNTLVVRNASDDGYGSLQAAYFTAFNALLSDAVLERTANAGVLVDLVHLKDGDVILNNNRAFYIKNTTGTPLKIATIDAGNQAIFSLTTIPTYIQGSQIIFNTSSGTIARFENNYLKVDGLTEHTADNGILVEGVSFKDNKQTIDPQAVIPNWEGALNLYSNTEQTNANAALFRARVDNALSVSKTCYLINDGSGDVVYLEANGTSRGLHAQVITPASQTGLSTNGLIKGDKFVEFTTDNGIELDGVLLKDNMVHLGNHSYFKIVSTDQVHLRNNGDTDFQNLYVNWLHTSGSVRITNSLQCDSLVEYTTDNGIDIEGVDFKDGSSIFNNNKIIYFNNSSGTPLKFLQVDTSNQGIIGSNDIVSSYVSAAGNIFFNINSAIKGKFNPDGLNVDVINDYSGSGLIIEGVGIHNGDLTADLKECIVTTDTPGTPGSGHMRMNSNILQYHNGTAWINTTDTPGGSADIERTISLPPDIWTERAGGFNSPVWDTYETAGWEYSVMKFADAGYPRTWTNILVPTDYDGLTFYIDLYWISSATSGNCRWSVQIGGKVDDETLDQSGVWASSINDAAKGTAFRLNKTTFTVSSNLPQAGDLLNIQLMRANNAEDTLSGDAMLLLIDIRYNSTVAFGSLTEGSLIKCNIDDAVKTTPVEGDMSWNDTDNRPRFYTGSEWLNALLVGDVSGGNTRRSIWLKPSDFDQISCGRGLLGYTPTLDFDANTSEIAYTNFLVPEGFFTGEGSDLKIYFYWYAAATSGNVIWSAQAKSIATGEAYNGGTGFSAADSYSASGTANTLIKSLVYSGTPGVSVGDIIHLQIYRSAVNGGDTMSGDARLIGVEISYMSSN